MLNILNKKNGCWLVGGLAFDNKVDAMIYASKTNSYLRFYFHDHMWESFDRNLLGKYSLNELYRQRAEQLRDTYDYLILYYSGGADSHNILRTFIDNKIKLDELRVKWPKPLKDGKLYIPNNKDSSAKNTVSEWDFAIKPQLDKLYSDHPEIKISFIEYTENIDRQKIKVETLEQEFYNLKMYKGSFASFVQRLNRDLYTNLNTRKKEGHIFGTDKPILNLGLKSIDLVFVDILIENTLFPSGIDNFNTEFFYWTPDFPLLPMEQAYQTAKFIKENKLFDCINLDSINPQSDTLKNKKESLRLIQKKILYQDTWNNNIFQAGKPKPLLDDVYFWMFENNEFDLLKNNFNIAVKNIFSQIDDRYLLSNPKGSILSETYTKGFKILDL